METQNSKFFLKSLTTNGIILNIISGVILLKTSHSMLSPQEQVGVVGFIISNIMTFIGRLKAKQKLHFFKKRKNKNESI